MKPWIEVSSSRIDDIIMESHTKTMIKNMIKKINLVILYFIPPGTGKTSTIMSHVGIFEKYNCKKNYIRLNASHDRGVNVVKNEIRDFVVNRSFNDKYKFVILDEVDSMTTNINQIFTS